jgi:ketosteroid isomerase-like protein
MSQENVEVHRRAVEAFNAHDVEAFVAFCDPSIEFHTAFAAVGGVYHGHHGVREWLGDLKEAWGAELRAEPEAYFDLGEQTLMFYMLRGRGRQSGVGAAMQLAQVARWRDGLVVRWTVYAQREDALRELGVSEEELEPIDPLADLGLRE